MSMSISVTPRERAKATALGASFGLVGMSAYYLPVTKDRFVRAAYNVVKNDTLDKVDFLQEAAVSASKGNLDAEQKVMLDQLEVGHGAPEIITKIKDLTKNITDSDVVKNMKKDFADDFKNCKSTEVMRDAISARAMRRVKWGNFGWGTGIASVLGFAMGIINANEVKHNDLI